MARAPTSRVKVRAAPAAKPVPPAETRPAETPPAETPPAETPPAETSSTERRFFAVQRDVLHDGELFSVDGDRSPALTQGDHGQLLSVGAVSAVWADGEVVP